MEPESERGARLLEDSPYERVYLVPGALVRPTLTSSYAVVSCNRRVFLFEEEFEAGVLVRELAPKLANSVFHSYSLYDGVPVVKG